MRKTTNNMFIGMQNEINFLKQSRQVFDIPITEFTHFVYDNTECKEFIEGKYTDKKPDIIFSSEKQLDGIDFSYKSVTMDLKVNGPQFDRAFFELEKNKYDKYSYEKKKDSHLIVSVITSGTENKIYVMPAGFIEMLANKSMPYGMPLPADFYDNKHYFELTQSNSTRLKNKQGVVILLDKVQDALRYYLSYYCTNNDMVYLMCKCKPFVDKDNTYIANKK